MGVYMCKHGDVCLQHALVKHSGSLVMRMVVCKFIAGRPTTAIPRVASAAEFIEPTQGFDCHESVINPDPRDSLQNKFDRSQVYLYEINKLLQPSSRPRQVLPYAVVSFTQNGAYLPAIDAEATAAERMASTVAQQNIANIINSKETLAPQPGATTVIPNPGPGLIGGPPIAHSPQLPSPIAGGQPLISTAVQNSTPVAATTVVTSVQQNGLNGDVVNPIPTEDKDPLKNVVTQLNNKLGTEVQSKPAVSPATNHRMPIAASPASAIPVSNAFPSHSVIVSTPTQTFGMANRFVRLPNGISPGLLPQAMPGILPAGALPGAFPPGLIPGQPGLIPGQPGVFPGQPGLLPGQPGLIPGQAGLLPGQAGLLPGQAGLIPGQSALIPGQPGMLPGQPSLFPGPQPMMFPMAAPSPVLKQPSVGYIPGMPSYPGAGIMGSVPGSVPTTKSPTAAQLGQSRPITPEVPAAGYVANNVSGYTPAIMGGTGSQNLGQPIPVLTNGTVQSSVASQVTQQTSQPLSYVGMPGMPTIQSSLAGAFPGFSVLQATPAAPGAQQFAVPYLGAFGGPQFTVLPQNGQKLAAGQNGLLQAAAAVPVQGVAVPTQSLKRPINDPYGVMDKRIRLA